MFDEHQERWKGNRGSSMYSKLDAKKKALEDVKTFARGRMSKDLKGKYHSPTDQEAGQAGTSDAKQSGGHAYAGNKSGQGADVAATAGKPREGAVAGGRQTTDYHGVDGNADQQRPYAAKLATAEPGHQTSGREGVTAAGEQDGHNKGRATSYADMSAIHSHGEKDSHSSVYAKATPSGTPGYSERKDTFGKGRTSDTPHEEDRATIPGKAISNVHGGRAPQHNKDEAPAGTHLSEKGDREAELTPGELHKLLAMKLTR